MRYLPKYNEMRLTYVDLDGNEYLFYCNEITSNRIVTVLLNQPIKDGGSTYITDSDINFEIDGQIIVGEESKRIVEIPELKQKKDNNTRRGVYRKDKVIVTS